jgi:hypothetical protein
MSGLRMADGYEVSPTLLLCVEQFYSQHDTIVPYACFLNITPTLPSVHGRALLQVTDLVYAYHVLGRQ